MLNLIWPIVVVVAGNCIYNVCSKATPQNANVFLSLTIGYVVAAFLCFIIYLIFNHNSSIGQEMAKLNWASYGLGASLIFLEIGGINLYRVGWNVSTGPLMVSICSAVALVLLGILVYKDAVDMQKIIGMLVCGLGIILINR